MIKAILLVGAGSFAGGIVRYLVSLALHPKQGGFPYPTFIVNIAGCFLIGLIYSWLSKYSSVSGGWMLLLATGFCGGFTTFSAFSNESLLMFQSGHCLMACTYILGSVILGLAAVFAGYALLKM